MVERVDGQRVFNELPAKQVFYYEDPNGKHVSIFGDRVSKFETTDDQRFRREVAMNRGKQLFESDTNVLFRALADNYRHKDVPKLHIGMFDIEINFDPKRGFSTPEDPYAEINALSIHLNWTDTMYTLALKPPTISDEQAKEICERMENTFLCKDEKELLLLFLDLIEDVDVLSGWNSTFFDIPYVVARIKEVLGTDYAKKLCLWDKKPAKRYINRFGSDQLTYDLSGRLHIDYLDLFKQHSPQEHHSYKLDYIGEIVVGEKKIPYDGSLYDLYHYDFEKFLKYNKQDVNILVKLDAKNSFIDLSMATAHTNSVLVKTTMGTVAMCDQAILNEAHDRGMVVHDKIKREEEHECAAGAYVADPKVGMHNEVAAIDINSLYPSVIRALNMCAETLLGQIKLDKTNKILKDRIAAGATATDAWHDTFGCFEYQDIINQTDDLYTIDFEDGASETRSAKEWYSFFFMEDRPICLSANGTLFRTDINGVIPGILERWYNERKEMQGKQANFYKQSKGIEIDEDLARKLSE